MVTYHNVLIQNDQLQELYTKKFPLIRREPTQKHRERNEACNILLLRHIHSSTLHSALNLNWLEQL